MCVCVCVRVRACVCVCVYIYIYIYIYLIEHNRHFFVYIFFVNALELPHRSYDIRRELIDKPSTSCYFPSIQAKTKASRSTAY